MKDTKSKELTPNQEEAQKRDAEARKGLELRDAEIVLAKPNRRSKAKKAKAKKYALVKVTNTAKKRDTQAREEARIVALAGILEQRGKNIQRSKENLDNDRTLLAARKTQAAVTRKALEGLKGKQSVAQAQ